MAYYSQKITLDAYWISLIVQSCLTQVYKFLQTDYHKYTDAFIFLLPICKISGGVQMINFLLVSFIHKSVKQFSYSFNFDEPTVWNELREEVRSLLLYCLL